MSARDYMKLVRKDSGLKRIIQMVAADPRPDNLYDAKELKMGTEEEFEHTDDREIASKIAKDHLDEDKKYYSKLKEAGF